MQQPKKIKHIILYTICLLMLYSLLHAQENIYIIGKGDVLEIAFWQDPTLDVTTSVSEDGKIWLSIGGAIKAEGLSIEELSEKIVESVSLYNRNITNAVVKIAQYESRKVYVMGSVRTPGKYTFEVIPNMWEILSEAGGPTTNANLSNVLIIRRNITEGEKSINVNLAEILRSKAFDQLPQIMPGDNIYVPATFGNVPHSGMDGIRAQENVLFLFGEVGNPGVYTFNEDLNILEALITASGPTASAKLNKVKVVRKTGAFSRVIEVDVERYIHESVPEFFMVQGGDAIFVPRRSSFRDSFLFDLLMIASGAAVTALVVTSIN